MEEEHFEWKMVELESLGEEASNSAVVAWRSSNVEVKKEEENLAKESVHQWNFADPS